MGVLAFACASPIGEDVTATPRSRAEDTDDLGGSGGAESGSAGATASGGSGGSAAGKGGGTSTGGKGGGASAKGGGGPGGSQGEAGSEAGGAEAAGGTEAAAGADAGGAGAPDQGGAGGTAAGGSGGATTAGAGGTGAAMGGMGGMIVEENPCPRVRVKEVDPFANIRPDPSTAQPAIGKAFTGEILDCLGKANGQIIEGDPNWYHVKSAAFDGWMSGTLADCTKDK